MSDPTASVTLPVAILQFLGQLAWPLALLTIIWRFRHPIESLLSRVASIKVGGSEWVFQEPTATSPTTTKQRSISSTTLGPDGFLTVESLRALVSQSGLLDGPADEVRKELLIFQTPRQRTWLVATDSSVFIALDDERTRTKWSLIQTVFEKSKALPLSFGEDQGSGMVRFDAEDTWWYYSFHLFPTTSALQEAVGKLIL